MTTRCSLTWLAAIVAVLLAPLGCASSSASRRPRSNVPDPAPDPPGRRTAPVGSATDPCADRLHALCGPLLLYYAINHRMPERLEELRDIGGPEPDIAFTCPVSGRPYVYDPDGRPRGDKPGTLVLYDAAPSHSGLRWAVAVEPPKTTGQALIPHVVLEEELLFQTPREEPRQ